MEIKNDENKDNIPKSLRYTIYILLLGLLGVVLGLGMQLLVDENNIENTITESQSKADSLIPTGDGVGIKFDDDIKDWNLKAAPYISPLLSQLARAPRTTLGAHKALCQSQRDALSSVLMLELPKKKIIASNFSAWRNSLKNALDFCLDFKPTGNDIRDIKVIHKKVEDTQIIFDKFLKSQLKDVNVDFNLNPEMFEK